MSLMKIVCKDDAPSTPNFAYINVDPNVHQLYGNGANDLAFELKLGRGETMDIWYYSLLIQSTSEIDNAIDQFEKSDADVETDNSLDFD
uniref:Uncharacterized protein n=1 Tax=Panagrolaimus superbus TaxID=310955 RepID=A0A914YE25_9BILA